MKINTLIYISIALLMVIFVACDDDLSTVGNGIRPNPDDIDLTTGEIDITAETVSMDSIYARTTYGLIGEYVDPIFGSIKSDYLCELYCGDTMVFQTGNDVNTIKIDSVQLNIMFGTFWGDSISPMGVSVYEVDKKPLVRNYYTNADPTEYCSMTNALGQSVFSIQNIKKASNGSRTITTPLKNEIGEFFFDKWKSNPEKFYNSDSLKSFFNGLYVTTNMGTGTLVNVGYTMFDIFYSYEGKNYNGTTDSTRTDLFRLTVTPEVIQLNHIENQNSDLVGPSNGKSYIKSPAGLCTELTIPLSKILSMADNGKVINSAQFKLLGMSEEEAQSKFSTRPQNLLLIHKDSVTGYFENKIRPNGTTTIIVPNSGATNIYNMGNLASIINYYDNYYKKKGTNIADIPDLKYRLIPVSVTYTSGSSSTTVPDRTYHSMIPTSAILNTQPDNMKMPLVFSKYNTQYDE